VAFAIGLSLFTGLASGLVPAFVAWRTSVNETLKEGGRTGTTGGHAWLRNSLVVCEIATALVLLAAAGLLLRSFEKMRSVELGYRPDHVLVASYSLPRKQYPTQVAVDEFNHELIRSLQQLPGVKHAGFTNFLPASGGSTNSTFVVDGYTPPKGADMNLATPMLIEGDYLEAMGIPLLAGRRLTSSDTADAPLVALVADVKENSPDAPDKEQWYQAVGQFEKTIGQYGSPTDRNGDGGSIVLRTALEPGQTANALRAAVQSIDPQLPLTQVQSMESALADSEAPRRFQTAMISAFALAAVLLAVLGIYSVIAFSAALRVQEMAIRMALGSQRSGILNLIFVSAIKLALAGCAIGLVATAAASRLLRALLFSVSPFDPLVLSLTALTVVALAIVASLLPATRAASIDPMKALRSE